MSPSFLAVSALSDATAAIPYAEGSAVSTWLLVKVIFLTALLLGLTYALLLFLKKKNLIPASRKSTSSGLKVVDSCRLGPRTTLYLVQHRSELILITESTQHVTTVVSGQVPLDPGVRPSER